MDCIFSLQTDEKNGKTEREVFYAMAEKAEKFPPGPIALGKVSSG